MTTVVAPEKYSSVRDASFVEVLGSESFRKLEDLIEKFVVIVVAEVERAKGIHNRARNAMAMVKLKFSVNALDVVAKAQFQVAAM